MKICVALVTSAFLTGLPTAVAASDNIGQLTQIKGVHYIVDGPDRAYFFDVPKGVFAFANKCGGRCASYADYRIRYDEKIISQKEVVAWVPSFCALLKQKAVSFARADGTGPRNRKLEFTCK